MMICHLPGDTLRAECEDLNRDGKTDRDSQGDTFRAECEDLNFFV